MRIRILFAIGFLMVSLFGCDDRAKQPRPPEFKPNKAELGENWKTFKHDTSFNVWQFGDDQPRPAEHPNPGGVRVFWDGTVTAEEKSLLNEGVNETLTACRSERTRWNPALFKYFLQPTDYKVLFVPPNRTVSEGAETGCAAMTTGPHGDCGNGPGTCKAAGTVGGLLEQINDSRPGSRGGVYILIPKQSPEQLARTECKTMMRNAVRNEAEHVFFTNDTGLYFMFANDAYPPDGKGHPYCIKQ